MVLHRPAPAAAAAEPFYGPTRANIAMARRGIAGWKGSYRDLEAFPAGPFDNTLTAAGASRITPESLQRGLEALFGEIARRSSDAASVPATAPPLPATALRRQHQPGGLFLPGEQS